MVLKTSTVVPQFCLYDYHHISNHEFTIYWLLPLKFDKFKETFLGRDSLHQCYLLVRQSTSLLKQFVYFKSALYFVEDIK